MEYLFSFPDWNSVDAVRGAHAFLEVLAIAFFAALAIFEVAANILQRRKSKHAENVEVMGIAFFLIAVLAELHAWAYSQRNDALSSQQDKTQKAQIATLENSTQALKTESQVARTLAEGFKAQMVGYDVRAKSAEAQVASAVAQVKTAEARIAEAQRGAAEAKKRMLEIQAIVMPLDLTEREANAVSAACRQYSGRVVMVGGNPSDIEGRLLTPLIVSALRKGGLNVRTRERQGLTFDDIGSSGVNISSPDQSFADGLGHILGSIAGLYVTVFRPTPNSPPPTETNISVGSYPFKKQRPNLTVQ